MKVIKSIILLGICLFLLWLVMYNAMIDFTFRKNSIKTKATVVTVQTAFIKSPYLVYQFKHKGKIIRIKKIIRQRQQIFGGQLRYLESLKPNDEIVIRYLANAPKTSSQIVHFMNKTLTNVSLCLGAFFFVILFLYDLYKAFQLQKNRG